MTSVVTFHDGTRIAYDRLGAGPPVVVLVGIFCTRQTTRDPAERLATRCTVVTSTAEHGATAATWGPTPWRERSRTPPR